MEYTTQMDAARKGIITKEMEAVAKKEYMDVNELVKLVACGKIIIPANKNHKCLEPNGIGSMLRLPGWTSGLGVGCWCTRSTNYAARCLCSSFTTVGRNCR